MLSICLNTIATLVLMEVDNCAFALVPERARNFMMSNSIEVTTEGVAATERYVRGDLVPYTSHPNQAKPEDADAIEMCTIIYAVAVFITTLFGVLMFLTEAGVVIILSLMGIVYIGIGVVPELLITGGIRSRGGWRKVLGSLASVVLPVAFAVWAILIFG